MITNETDTIPGFGHVEAKHLLEQYDAWALGASLEVAARSLAADAAAIGDARARAYWRSLAKHFGHVTQVAAAYEAGRLVESKEVSV